MINYYLETISNIVISFGLATKNLIVLNNYNLLDKIGDNFNIETELRLETLAIAAGQPFPTEGGASGAKPSSVALNISQNKNIAMSNISSSSYAIHTLEGEAK